MSIAIMVLVHQNENQANRLIKHLSKGFDIYVHIDKKSSLKIENTDNIFVYKKYKVYWGSLNIVMATLHLMEEAYKKGYDRYILISGMDLPIKTNKEIVEFFKNNNNEYIQLDKMPIKGLVGNGGFDRVTKYWPNVYRRKENILCWSGYVIKRRLYAGFSIDLFDNRKRDIIRA